MSEERIQGWIKELVEELKSVAKPTVKTAQENYMKHVVKFYGVKNPEVRSIVSSLIRNHKVQQNAKVLV